MILLVLFSLTAAITLLGFVAIFRNTGMPGIGKFSITGWYSFYPAFLFQVYWWVDKYWEYLK